MKKFEENVLIEIIKDKELDVFGIYKKRKQMSNKDKIRFQRDNNKKKIMFYTVATRKLIDTYGIEGAMPYLKALFKEDSQIVQEASKNA